MRLGEEAEESASQLTHTCDRPTVMPARNDQSFTTPSDPEVASTALSGAHASAVTVLIVPSPSPSPGLGLRIRKS